MCGKLQTALIFQSLFLCAVIMQSSHSALGHVLQKTTTFKQIMYDIKVDQEIVHVEYETYTDVN